MFYGYFSSSTTFLLLTFKKLRTRKYWIHRAHTHLHCWSHTRIPSSLRYCYCYCRASRCPRDMSQSLPGRHLRKKFSCRYHYLQSRRLHLHQNWHSSYWLCAPQSDLGRPTYRLITYRIDHLDRMVEDRPPVLPDHPQGDSVADTTTLLRDLCQFYR